MARPKLGEGESERLQMVITTAELRDIEEWQHLNRIASKSEAIRRLCKIALFIEDNLETLLDDATQGVTILGEQMAEFHQLDKMLAVSGDDLFFDYNDVSDITHLASEHARIAWDGISAIQQMLTTMHNVIVPLAEEDSVRSGERKMKQVIDEANERVDSLSAMSQRYKDNRYLSIAMNEQDATEKERLNGLSEEEEEAYWNEKIAQLAAEEEDDYWSFAERHGLLKFWEKKAWAKAQRIKTEQLAEKKQ